MMARGRRRGLSRQQQPSWGWPIVAVGVAAAVVAGYLRYPAVAVLWVSLVVAAWMEPPAILTGTKDKSGFPTPAHAGEERCLRRFRFWRFCRIRLVLPNGAWLPGWPPLGAFAASSVVAFAAWCLPVSAEVPASAWLNAVAGFISCATVTAARRSVVPEGPDCPGTRLDSLPLLIRGRRGAVLLGSAFAVAASAACMVLVFVPRSGSWAPVSNPAPATAAAVLACTVVIAHPWRAVALARWRLIREQSALWSRRWVAVKMDPPPELTDHYRVGPATVDEFAASAALGAQAFWSLAGKIAPAVGAGNRVAILELPDVDGQGQPMPGTRHPLRFQVVAWPASELPDLTDPSTPDSVAELYARCAFALTTDALGYGRAVFVDCERISTEPHAVGVTAAAAEGEKDPSSAEIDPDTVDGGAGTSNTVARASRWAFPGGPSMVEIRHALLGELAAGFGCEVLIDHRQEVLYFGALTGDTTTFGDGQTGAVLADLAREDHWNFVWSQVLKRDANPPTVQHATLAAHDLPVGDRSVTVHRVGFVTLQGIDPTEYFGLEAKLATALNAAPFVSVTGWPAPAGRPGTRHPQAFAVSWSDGRVPASPAELSAAGAASRIVLAGRLNAAFAAARLARPELASAHALTDPGSRGHIWEITVRLYSGVTLSDVRAAAPRIQRDLDVPWMRIAPAEAGCTIIAGAEPGRVTLADPRRDRLRLNRLDWQQAFVEAKVTGNNGLVPDLTGSAPLPRNDRVQVLDFDLPPGLDIATVRAGLSKLKVATGNDFVEIRPGPAGASTLRLLTSRTNPLPDHVDFDFDTADTVGGLVFATGVDGEPLVFDPAENPHLLLVGASGSGKSTLAQDLLYGAAARSADLFVIDPVKGGADFGFARPYARAFATDLRHAAAVMKAVYAIVVDRKHANASAGVGSYRDLSTPPPPIYVLIDEFTSLTEAEAVPRPSDDADLEAERDRILADNLARQTVGVLAGKLAREARSAGVTLLLGTQKLSARMLDGIPGAGDLKASVARILLGKSSFGERASALRVPDDAPTLDGDIPKGRGLWEPLTSSAAVIQTWYASQTRLGDELRRRREPLRDDELLDLTGFLPATPEPSETAGAVIAPTDAVADLGDMVFDLTDLTDLDETEGNVTGPGSTEDARAASDRHPEAAADDGRGDIGERAPTPAPITRPDVLLVMDHDRLSGLLGPFGRRRPAPPGDGRSDRKSGATDVFTTLLRCGARFVWLTAAVGEVPPTPAGSPPGGELVGYEAGPGPGGWRKLEALQRHLAVLPTIRRLVWVDPELESEDDDLGVAFSELAEEILNRAGIDHLLISQDPAEGLTQERLRAVEDFLGEEPTPSTTRPGASPKPAPPKPDPGDRRQSRARPEGDPFAPSVPDPRRTGPRAAEPTGQADPFARAGPSAPVTGRRAAVLVPDDDPFG